MRLAPKLLNPTSTGRPELGPCSCLRFIHETAERGQQVTVGAVTAGYVACDPQDSSKSTECLMGVPSHKGNSHSGLFKLLNFQVSTFLLVDFFFFITDTSTDQTRTRSVSKQCHALKHSSISLAVAWPTSACCKIKYPFVTTDAERELSKTSLNTARPFLG